MREILYQYHNRGMYTTSDNTSFSHDSSLKLIIEPHQFSMSISGEVLRSTSFPGGTILVSQEGAAVFYDLEEQIIAQIEKGDRIYKEVRFIWEQDQISLQFGEVCEIDYYPNCDGEHDRWGTEWVAQRTVTLNLKDHSVEVE